MHSDALKTAELVVELILKLKPESLLDLGVGSGRWGFLFREYTDLWNGRVAKNKWKSQIDGIEIYTPLLQDYQRAVYGHIYEGNAFTLIDELHSYDFVWAFDLLGAFEKNKGYEMLKKAKEKTGMLLAVWQTLDEKVPVPSKTGNPYDARVSNWSLNDFYCAGFHYYKIYPDASGGKQILAFYTEEDLGKMGLSEF
jgi:hypothetical protein